MAIPGPVAAGILLALPLLASVAEPQKRWVPEAYGISVGDEYRGGTVTRVERVTRPLLPSFSRGSMPHSITWTKRSEVWYNVFVDRNGREVKLQLKEPLLP